MGNNLIKSIHKNRRILVFVSFLCVLLAAAYFVPRLFKRETDSYKSRLAKDTHQEASAYRPSWDTFQEFFEKEHALLQPDKKDEKTASFTVTLSEAEKERLQKDYEQDALLPYNTATLKQIAVPDPLSQSQEPGVARALFNKQLLSASRQTFEKQVGIYTKLKQNPNARKKILSVWGEHEKAWKEYIGILSEKEYIQEKGKSPVAILWNIFVPQELRNLISNVAFGNTLEGKITKWLKTIFEKTLVSSIGLLCIAVIVFLQLNQAISPKVMQLLSYASSYWNTNQRAELVKGFPNPMEAFRKWRTVLAALLEGEQECLEFNWYQDAKKDALQFGSFYYYITWIAPTILSQNDRGACYNKLAIGCIIAIALVYFVPWEAVVFQNSSKQHVKNSGMYGLALALTILGFYIHCGARQAAHLALSMEKPFQVFYLFNPYSLLQYALELLTTWLGVLSPTLLLLSIIFSCTNSFLLQWNLEHFLRRAKKLSRLMEQLVQDETMTPMENTKQLECMQAYVREDSSIKEILKKIELHGYYGIGVYLASLYHVFSGAPHHETFVEELFKPEKGKKWKNALFAYKELVDAALFIENEEQAKGSNGCSHAVIPDIAKYGNAKRPVIDIKGAHALKKYKGGNNETKKACPTLNNVKLGQGLNVAIVVGEPDTARAYVKMIAQQILCAAVTGKITGTEAAVCFPDKLFYADAKEESYEAHYKSLGDILHYAQYNPDKKILILIANAYGGVAVAEAADLLYAYCKVLRKLPNVTCLLSTSNTRLYERLQPEDRFKLLTLQLDKEKKATGIVISGKNEGQLVTEYLLKQKVTPEQMKKVLRKMETPNRDIFVGISDPYTRNIILALLILFLLMGFLLFFSYIRRPKAKEL